MIDDDVIDVTHLSEEDRREHMRRISQLQTCPCCYCQAICDRTSAVAECRPYQEWREHNERIRGIRRLYKR